VQLHAVDLDPAAVACARRNLAAVGGRVHLGNLDEPLPADLRGHVDVLVANVPYVPTAALGLMPAEAREYEPRATHDGGSDGLDVARRVIALAPRWLAPAGAVLIETAEDQAEALAAGSAAAGLVAEIDHSDDGSGAVIVIGRRAVTAA
jgi:release factor glutamine methyltransferase